MKTKSLLTILGYNLLPLMIFFILFSSAVTAGITFSNQAQNVSYPAFGDWVNLSITAANNTVGTIDYLILATNETGSWVNYTGVANRYVSGLAATSVTVQFNWTNSSLYNAIVGWKVWGNQSDGTWSVSNVMTFTAVPYVNATSAVKANISSFTCSSTTTCNATFSNTTVGYLDVLMDYHCIGATCECDYNMSNVYNSTASNLTEICYLRGYLKDIAAGTILKIQPALALRVAPPSNLPAALGAAAVGCIVVIYVITKKYRRKGW